MANNKNEDTERKAKLKNEDDKQWVVTAENIPSLVGSDASSKIKRLSSRATPITQRLPRIIFRILSSPDELAGLVYTRVPPEQITVYVSSSCADPEHCETDGTIFSITKPPYAHNFDPCGKDNDLAIIELDREIPSTIGTPICMMEEDEQLAEELIALGYGDDPNNPIPEGKVFNRLQGIKIDSRDVMESSLNIIALLDNRSLCTVSAQPSNKHCKAVKTSKRSMSAGAS
ncbi:hypothetical protein TELCIR_05430 [Teladorsagia circumcincta]|uniref:Peptidase S1 domain-containing protein n=1 Tax=Teladorsagia circumcincta TaxID=45464 RepID=A0A2G9UQT2_TELCI|nr:hypothetical protein TELCIR_05430 [Teladorsagia circumcincta]